MENRCCVLGCLKTSDDGVKLHEFPFDNQLLLPIWIMATNRSEWLPIAKSRICDKHFSIDDYEAGDKSNMLKPNACPMINTNNSVVDTKPLTDSEYEEFSSTSDFNCSDIDSDDLPDTPNTSDLKFSDDDSILSTSSCSNYSNSNEATGFDDDFLSSLSDTEFEPDNIDVEESMLELDSVSLSSSITSFVDTNQPIDHVCAVVLCNQNARNQFDRLFFINFPIDNKALCETWWKICGRKDKFDPLSKICSIHFDPDDFTSITIRREGQLFRQTIMKNNNTVPTLYLQSHEYLKFTRKRKRSVNDSSTGIQNNSTENEFCIIQGCDKTFVKDGKKTLFFKFPLENKTMLKKWINSIGLPNFQPTVTDRVCSDHFENNDVLKINDVYSLNNDSIPSIKPQNSFVLRFEDDYDKKYRSSGSKRNIDFVFNNLEFSKLEENTLIVKDITKEKKNKSKLLNSLENKLDVQELKNNEKIFNTSATQSSSTKINDNKETFNKSNYGDVIDILDNINNKQGTLSKHKNVESSIDTSIKPYEEEITKEKKKNNENSTKVDLEYVYMDVLNYKNMMEEQPTIYTNNSVKVLTDECNQTKLVYTPNINNLKKVSTDVSNITSISKNKCNSKVVKKSHKESITKIISDEQNMIPKSRNNGNDCDYIYLDMLDGDDAKNVLSFEKRSISKNSKTKILKLLEKNHTDGIPESIIYNKDLIECYGEMLPPYCDQDCQLICYYSIPGPERRQIYKEFQMLHNATEQNCKITQLVQLRMTKKRDDTFESCPTYHFVRNKESIKVCRTFFMNTLGISEHRLDAILKPINYSWYSDRDTALKANQPKQVNVINEPVVMTDFMKESSIPLDKDYNLYEPESDSEVSLENVPFKEYENVFLYMKGIPRVLSSYRMPGTLKKHFFETSICLEYMYKTYSENFIRNKTPPPYTKRQFKKIYNQYMKTFLKMV
ncbi:uncharacterized protein LOC132921565 isoform X2 [Rhopalosiphum padi]|uniref:uncharacterized protein LOC132921565 isoform X2 n=1 Tax=Rhopalosiphum padi TaxID=40932 RepID=UPI00298D9290|nr:uncharacterized protein LOC132921565 isoform X2 [Rhopalosiphum padi]